MWSRGDPYGDAPLAAEHHAATVEQLAAAGLRIIAIATGTVPRPADDELDHDQLRGLRLLGLVGMIDPLRPETAAAVASCQRAGVRVVMITGDHPGTSVRSSGSSLLPTTRTRWSPGHSCVMRAAWTRRRGQARSRGRRVHPEPSQKLVIVESLTSQGHIVAVTGAGANDAPALHHAHVGAAMGSGTDGARDAAELIVTDRFSSIAAGVHQGRVGYANVRKVIQLLVTTGAG